MTTLDRWEQFHTLAIQRVGYNAPLTGYLIVDGFIELKIPHSNEMRESYNTAIKAIADIGRDEDRRESVGVHELSKQESEQDRRIYVPHQVLGEVEKIVEALREHYPLKGSETELIQTPPITPPRNFLNYGREWYRALSTLSMRLADTETTVNLANIEFLLNFSHCRELEEIGKQRSWKVILEIFARLPIVPYYTDNNIYNSQDNSWRPSLIEQTDGMLHTLWNRFDSIYTIPSRMRDWLIFDSIRWKKFYGYDAITEANKEHRAEFGKTAGVNSNKQLTLSKEEFDAKPRVNYNLGKLLIFGYDASLDSSRWDR